MHPISIFTYQTQRNANENTSRSVFPCTKNFFRRTQTLRESNLNILPVLYTRIRSIDVHNLLRNFNRRHGSHDTIHIPRKHRSRMLYINDPQRAENSRAFPYSRRASSYPDFRVSFAKISPSRRPFRRTLLPPYVGGSPCIRRNSA